MHSDIDNKNKEPAKELTALDPDVVNELRATVASDEVISFIAQTFHILGDPTRLKILFLLRKHSCCVRDLAILTSVSESAISHHMRLLKERRIVTQRREGTIIYYSLSDHHLAPLFQEAEYHADHVYRDRPDHSHT
jgi:ArsR family transcriptional regulator, lead/cadmium/zinc/bismuth-responsive transcriptional repressor